VGGRREVVSSEKEENGLEISSRAHFVTHLAAPPTSRVPPSYVASIRQRKTSPHPSKAGRGSQPRFHIEEREEREAMVVVGDKRGTETDPA